MEHFLNQFVLSVRELRRRYHSANHYKRNELNNPGDYNSYYCFDYYKCIFIHIPKSGGTSVSKSLFGNWGMSHMTYDWYVKKFGINTVDRYFKFSFVRNPWDRLYSAFLYLKRDGMNEHDEHFHANNLRNIHSFEQFVLEWLNEDTIRSYWHFIPQIDFLTVKDDRKNLRVNFLGRFENLDNDYRHVCKALNIKNRPLLHLNRNDGNTIQYTKVYSTEMALKVEHLYAEDITLLQYSF